MAIVAACTANTGLQEGKEGCTRVHVASYALSDTSLTAEVDGDTHTVQWNQHTQVGALHNACVY